jgi:transposase-like protein
VVCQTKNWGVDNIIFAVVDEFKGLPDAIIAVFSRAIVRIVHHPSNLA